MRLFVAIDIDPATRAQLAFARAAIQAGIANARVAPRVTWVREDVAHVTVRFIGETPGETLPVIQQALASLAIEPFDVTWGSVGTFGGTRHPRVIWVSPTVGQEALVTVAERVSAAVGPLLGPAEARDLRPHLTLGRVREPGRDVDWKGALAAVAWVPSVTHVAHVVLYQSRLSPRGSTYTALSSHG